MSEADWLALPDEEQAAPQKTAELMPAVAAEGVDLQGAFAPPKVSDKAITVARERVAERDAFVKAWKALTARQKIYLRALQQTGFSHARALKVLRESIKLEPQTGKMRPSIAAGTVQRWGRENSNYKIVLAALKAEAAVQVTSRDDLLLRAHRAAEYAEAEQPILHQGQDTGFRERQVGEMLKANEQIAKITKVLGGEERSNGGAVGPALVIQVVQRDGGLVDVTPKGVTIELPVPSGD